MEKQQKNNQPAGKKTKEHRREKQAFTDPGIKAEMEIRKRKNKPATGTSKRKT